MASAPFIRLESNANSSEWVIAIRKVLENSREGLPNPDFSVLRRQLTDGLGIKSASDLEKPTVKHCAIQLRDNIITFIPTKHAIAPDKGYVHSSNDPVSVSKQADDKEISEALQLAISRCE